MRKRFTKIFMIISCQRIIKTRKGRISIFGNMRLGFYLLFCWLRVSLKPFQLSLNFILKYILLLLKRKSESKRKLYTRKRLN